MNDIDIWIHIFSIIIILFFSIFYSVYIILYPNVYLIIKFIAFIILICSIYIALNRNTYLPFLGYSVFPSKLLNNEVSPLNANLTGILDIDEIDNTIIVYWGAMNKGHIHNNPKEAYGDYSNSGIAFVKNKKATIKFNCPDNYIVGYDVKKHIHYRIIKPNSIMMSPVYKKEVYCK